MVEREDPEREGTLARVRRQYPWIDHLIRANEAFTQRYGKHYAAAITYFSVLSVIPILMVLFAIVGFVLQGNELIINQIKQGINQSVPEGLDKIVTNIVAVAIDSGGALGAIGFVIALYAGIGWMSNLRDALTAQWGQPYREVGLVSKALKDLAALVGLGLALAVSFALTAVGAAVGTYLLELVGLAEQAWANVLLRGATIVLTLIADTLVFIWVIARLPRDAVAVRGVIKAAVLTAIGFVLLQQLATVYLGGISEKPAFAVFGSVLGLLIFANLVARLLLLTTAWAATAKENRSAEIAPPPPVTIRPNVQVNRGLGIGAAAGVFGLGAVLGWFGRNRW